MTFKKYIFTFATIIATTFSFISHAQHKSFARSVWSEIDLKTDSTLFVPYNGTLNPYEISTRDFNLENYLLRFESGYGNLWNIIHAHIIGGELQVYSPYNPMYYVEQDEGWLRYPLVNMTKPERFHNSERVREELFDYLGVFGPSIDYPLTDIWGEDSVDSDGFTVYPPRDQFWYTDSDIIKYKIREDIILNKKGKEKKRVIKSIAPVVYSTDENGNIRGEKELFWIDFSDLETLLNEEYYLDPQTSKPVNFSNYFLKRKFPSKIIKEDKKVIQPIE